MNERGGRRWGDDWRRRAIWSFRARFWNEAGGYLFDVVDGPDGDDAAFRPNQVFAPSFDAPLVDEAQGRRVLELIRRRLLTPKGLRTLAEDDVNFHGRYAVRARPAMPPTIEGPSGRSSWLLS